MAWEGGHSLHVTGQAAEGQSVTVHLFKTDLPVPPGTRASLRLLGFPDTAAAELGLTFKDAPNAPVWLPLHGKGQPPSADGGWSTAESNVSRFNKRQLARVSLRFSAGKDGGLDFRLGQLRSRRTADSSPGSRADSLCSASSGQAR
ncbi:hypothetical protein IV500_00820 [Paeniglutamicibacter antarcticus]|uniref:Uncharacterized protein n=1 Tax=Arthrobacter terrae TaxID=2935737 RepID=A0A931G3Q6_9MICC|nr:hypothetical protein [Arthrobacter terrae]MBG0737983.1 hypothetical protein [Arthrobacter terrae]